VNGPAVAWAVLRKDLQLDLRTRERIGQMAVFAFLVAALLSIVLPEAPVSGPADRGPLGGVRTWIPALMWIVLLFTALLGLSRSFQAEGEAGAVVLLLQVPCDRGWVFAGKAAANFVSLLGIALWTALLFAVFLDVDWSAAGWRGPAIAALGTAGLSVLGTLLAALSLGVRFREFLLPLLLFPLVLPVLVIASRLTGDALAGLPSPDRWWGVLALFDWVFALVGYFVFDYVLED
jgi:heme exporter protein B